MIIHLRMYLLYDNITFNKNNGIKILIKNQQKCNIIVT